MGGRIGWLSGLLGLDNNFQALGPDGKPITSIGQSGFQAHGPASQGYGGAIQQGMSNAQDNYGQQQDYINMLRAQSNGEGPSVAQNLLGQQTQANQRASASAIASQRGMNPAMQAKLILDQQANQNQQAAGQGALLRAQEMTQSRSLLGGALGQQGAQNLGMFGAAGGLQQGQDALGLGAQQINANTAMGNAQSQNYGLGLNSGVAQQNANTNGALVGGLLKGAGGAMALARGGEVPGQDSVQGDSYANDTVKARLSPHEIVLPLSVTQAEDAPERAKSFVEAIKGKAKKKAGGYQKVLDAGRGYCAGGMVQGYAGGGEVSDGSTFFMGAPDDPFTTLGVPPPSESATPAPPGGSTQTTLPPELASVHAPFAPPPAPAGSSPFHKGIQAAGATPPTQAPAPKAPPDSMAGIPGIGALNKAGAQEQQALQQEGQAKAAGMADIAQKSSAAAQQGSQDAERAMQDVQARVAEQDNRAKQIADVNPNRYWENLGTGGKITSAIGMILGGMGSGLTGGPNHAFEAIQNAIGRDIDAQKANIGKKQNELHTYMEGTRDLQAAQHALAAQHWAVAASQIEAATAKMGSQTALPAAQAAMAQAKQKQIVETQAYVARMNELKQQKMGMDFAQQRMNILTAARGSKDPAAMAVAGKELEYLEKPGKRGEEQVDVPEVQQVGTDKEGNPRTQVVSRAYYGKSPEHAKEASKAMIRQRNIETALGDLEQFTKGNPLGGVPGTFSVGKAKAAAAMLRQNLEGTLSDMNRPASPETAKAMEEIVSDPTAFFKSPSKYEGAMKFVRQIANEHKQAVIDAYTLGPMN